MHAANTDQVSIGCCLALQFQARSDPSLSVLLVSGPLTDPQGQCKIIHMPGSQIDEIHETDQPASLHIGQYFAVTVQPSRHGWRSNNINDWD